MAMSSCRACDRVFGGLTAFDKHLPPAVDGPKQRPCLDPAKAGLVNKPYDGAGDHWLTVLARANGVWSMPWDAEGVFGTSAKPAERVLAGPRPCATCKRLMAKKPGRGRFPKNCAGCGGTGTLVE